jgi:hypothetical protein
MQRLLAKGLPAYALVITFLAVFQGWPFHHQIAAEPQQSVAVTDAAKPTTPVRAEATATYNGGYPIPAPVKPPKHLFHLVFRYEGDGLIDQNAVAACTSCVMQAATGEKDKTPEKPAAAKSAGSNLFHFLVRYEGEGLVDNSVVELVKAYLAAESGQKDEEATPEGKVPPATKASPATSCTAPVSTIAPYPPPAAKANPATGTALPPETKPKL